MRYFIIGFKSSGKTTIGKKLANRLGMDFIDLDEFIEETTGKTIPEFYDEIGDDEFRKLEWKALKEVVKKDNIIISTGGGAPCYCNNMNLMEQYGDVIYIRLDNATLVSRLKNATKSRPIVKNKTIKELHDFVSDLKGRCEHHYLRAKYIIDGKNITINDLVEQLSN